MAGGPEISPHPSPFPSPYISISVAPTAAAIQHDDHHKTASNLPVKFSPPLIAMVVVVAAAFLVVTYSRLISRRLLPPIMRPWRRWRGRRRQRRLYSASSRGDLESLPGSYGDSDSARYHPFSQFGLHDSVIKTIPLSVYAAGDSRDCAVCLLEFEEDDYVRTLPVCSHAFHVDCIDAWLRSHGNCPLCRAGIFRQGSPFVPEMAARIRPSLDGILDTFVLEPLSETAVAGEEEEEEEESITGEIVPAAAEEWSPARVINFAQVEDHLGGDGGGRSGDSFLLKRSYSFGFERNFPSERMVMEAAAATASPWRYRRGNFWSKRASPFGSLTKSRVFSFRYYRGMKSPAAVFCRRIGFFPLSESSSRSTGGVACGGSSSPPPPPPSRRSKSMTSPMFGRPQGFPSSRLRCGDLEALLSPDRYGRR